MYNKLFAKILDSSIWLAPDPHRLVWITLIAAMDEDGNCMYSCVDNLAARARVQVEAAEAAIAAFEAPDTKSGDPEHEGRRVERIPGGWHVLNAHKYRAMVTKAIIREQTRQRTQRYRANKRDACVTHCDESVTPSIALSESKATSRAISAPAAPSRPAFVDPPSTTTSPPEFSLPAGREKISPPTAAAWSAYAQAYLERYGIEPVRNAKVNAQISKLVSRLGAEEAPQVAAAYVANRSSLYVAAKHCTDLLLRDAEKLRTEWATGNVVHSRDAREEDRLSSTGAMWSRVGKKLKERGIE